MGRARTKTRRTTSIWKDQHLDVMTSGQQDIRLFLMKGAKQTTLHASSDKNLTFSIPKSKDDPIDKMRMIRNKMVEATPRYMEWPQADPW